MSQQLSSIALHSSIPEMATERVEMFHYLECQKVRPMVKFAENTTSKSSTHKHSTSSPKADQSERFKQAALELGCDDDPERFKDIVRKIGSAPPSPKETGKAKAGSTRKKIKT